MITLKNFLNKKTGQNIRTEIPKTAFVVFNNGALGGAEKRFTNLFLNLHQNFPGTFSLFVNLHLFNQLTAIYENLPLNNIKIVDLPSSYRHSPEIMGNAPRFFSDRINDPLETDKNASLPRKIYWYYKNKFRQYYIHKKIDNYRKDLGIKVFIGVFSGVLNLIFYLGKTPRKAAVIFSDMDSWFSDVHSDMKRLWYRKYYSFNDILERSDLVDFLSPYILEGVRKRGVKLNEDSIEVAPGSFADYSKCKSGEKRNFEVAFCSRLEPDKNPMMFLEAAMEILNNPSYNGKGIKFHVLGEGTLVNEVGNFIRTNNLEKYINFQFHKNPPEILSETTVFVSIQSNTNYPSQSVLEAMACGNAVIASDVGDTKLFINEKTGFLIPLNKDSLVSALEFCINNKKLVQTLGKNAMEYVKEKHTLDNCSEYYIRLINKAYRKVFKEKK